MYQPSNLCDNRNGAEYIPGDLNEFIMFVHDLPYSSRRALCQILDANGKWTELAGKLGFKSQQVHSFGLAIHRQPGFNSPTDELLTEWSHSNPTVDTLYKQLNWLNCKRAADEIKQYVTPSQVLSSDDDDDDSAEEDFGCGDDLPPPEFKRTPVKVQDTEVKYGSVAAPTGPPASMWTMEGGRQLRPDAMPNVLQNDGSSLNQQQMMQSFQSFHVTPQRSAEMEQAHEFQYDEIKKLTYGFDEEFLIVKGGFGEVYKGISAKTTFAIKRLLIDLKSYGIDKTTQKRYMKTEVENIVKRRHPNLLALAGYSVDGPELCFVYEYTSNGSLADRLQDIEPGLSAEQRCRVLLGTACGIQYLHNDLQVPHGDITSANILLDKNLEVKVSNFGQAGMTIGQFCHVTPNDIKNLQCASKAYLPPEFDKELEMTLKGDIYSFGIVVCECCTGEMALDEKREGGALLKDFVENRCGVEASSDSLRSSLSMAVAYERLCDRRLTNDWTPSCWYLLLVLAKDCIADKKKHRPHMKTVYERLENLYCEMQRSKERQAVEAPLAVQPTRTEVVHFAGNHPVLHSQYDYPHQLAPPQQVNQNQRTADPQFDMFTISPGNSSPQATNAAEVLSSSGLLQVDSFSTPMLQVTPTDYDEDDIPDKDFPSFVGSFGCHGSSTSDSGDNYSSCSSDRTSLNEEITTKGWPGFVPMTSNPHPRKGAAKAISFEALVVQNCDKYRSISQTNEGKCHSDPGARSHCMNKISQQNTLSGPRASTSPAGRGPIYSHIP